MNRQELEKTAAQLLFGAKGFILPDSNLDYLEIITCQMKKTVEENNISQEYFQKHFVEIYTAVHNSYQAFLKGLLTDQEYKDRLFNKVWEELRAE